MSLLNEIASANFIEHAKDLWFNPELERKKQLGLVKETYIPTRMQVIFCPDSDVKRVINFDSDVVPVERIMADKRYADCGHATFWSSEGIHLGAFDLRHYKGKAALQYQSAMEFLESARDQLAKGKLRPFIDNLFSAMELLVESMLFVMSEQEYVKKPKHNWTIRKFSSFINQGNMNPEYARVLGDLSRLRDAARYNKAEFNIEVTTAYQYLELVGKLGTDVKMQIT